MKINPPTLSGKSAETALLSVTVFIERQWEEKRVCVGVFLDVEDDFKHHSERSGKTRHTGEHHRVDHTLSGNIDY